jgi:hypothetical protein
MHQGSGESSSELIAAEPCASCGAQTAGDFCSACGEERPRAGDLSVRRTAGELLGALTTLDSRAWRTFYLLITRPGVLTAELAAGRRRPYLSPLSLFVVANLLYFLIGALGLPVATFGVPLRAHVGGVLDLPVERLLSTESELDWRGRLLVERTRDEGWTNLPRVEAQFDVIVEQQAKALMIVLTPGFALLIALMRARRREPGGLHVVFALHYVALTLLLFVAAGFVLQGVLWVSPENFNDNSPWIPLGIVVVLTTYLTIAFRNVYRSRPPAALAQAVVLAAAWVYFVDWYRAMLYVTALYSI